MRTVLRKEQTYTVFCLLFGREQAESGSFDLRLSEHDGERVNDQRAQSETQTAELQSHAHHHRHSNTQQGRYDLQLVIILLL